MEVLTAWGSLWCSVLCLVVRRVVVVVWQEKLGRAQIPSGERAEKVRACGTTEEVGVVHGVPGMGRGKADGLSGDAGLQLVWLVGVLSAMRGVHGWEGKAGEKRGQVWDLYWGEAAGAWLRNN